MSNDKPESFQEALQRALKKTRQVQSSKENLLGELGKIPPQAVDLERVILGAILIEAPALEEVLDILSPDSFYKDEHKIIYETALELHDKGQPIDLMTMVDALMKKEKLDFIGGPYELTELTNQVGSAANIEYHARLVQEKYLLREMIRASQELQHKGFDKTTDPFELLDFMANEVNKIDNLVTQGQSYTVSQVLAQVIKNKFDSTEAIISNVVSGVNDFDLKIAGFQPTDLIIIAARPGLGKTTLALNIATATAKKGLPVGFISLEMSKEQLVERLIAAVEKIDSRNLRKNYLSDEERKRVYNSKVGDLPIFINDDAGLNLRGSLSQARSWVKKMGVKVLLLDYIQLLSVESKDSGRSSNREQEVAQISRSLKKLAKELKIPVIALAQLSRAVESRGGMKRPMLSDLRESGSIEQDADQVIFLYRAEYYGFEQDDDGNSTKGVAEFILAKNRHGVTGTHTCKLIIEYGIFEDFDYVEHRIRN